MPQVVVERLDHHGVVSGVIKDLRIVESIDSRIDTDPQEEITAGEAIAGMIINGLGFSNRPMSLTPQFFQNKPLDVFFREGVRAEHFNRFKLGRSLDDVYAYGCDLLFSEISVDVCQQERVDLRFHSLDTTSFSLTGDYMPDSDEQAIRIVHGYSKDHRPDLKQAVLETIVSQDGGVPLMCKSWDGNASDNKIFEARAAGLIQQFQAADGPRYLVADSKLYTEENASNLSLLTFITRIPETLSVVKDVIEQAWDFAAWNGLNPSMAYQRLDLSHYEITQRWLVVYSKEAEQRAQKTLDKAMAREYEQTQKALFHLQAQRFSSPQDAQKALSSIAKKLKYHRIEKVDVDQHIRYANKGRPGPQTPIKDMRWQINAHIQPDAEKLEAALKRKATFVIGTNIPDAQLSDEAVIQAYKGQSAVETGFRFLKDPLFFTSSLFVKKPSRMQALLTVMTLALLVYSLAQRRMRANLEAQKETLPDQIGRPTERPTLRWVFQMLEGIHRVVLHTATLSQTLMEGLSELRIKILRLFGQNVCHIYQISSA
jgi:transposase